jgi:hypothetical protein
MKRNLTLLPICLKPIDIEGWEPMRVLMPPVDDQRYSTAVVFSDNGLKLRLEGRFAWNLTKVIRHADE